MDKGPEVVVPKYDEQGQMTSFSDEPAEPSPQDPEHSAAA
jgi:hypothetical protein